MVKVSFQKVNSIPVEIGDVKFEFKYDDNSMDKLIKNQEKLSSSIDKYKDFKGNKIPENFSMKSLRKDIETATDTFLGNGTFKKIYQINPSTITIALTVIVAMNKIGEELQEQFAKVQWFSNSGMSQTTDFYS